MAKIVTLKNNNDEEVYPITTAEAVNGGLYADNGIEVTGVIPDVTTSRIADGAVTSDKIDWTTLFPNFCNITHGLDATTITSTTLTQKMHITLPVAGKYLILSCLDTYNQAGGFNGEVNTQLSCGSEVSETKTTFIAPVNWASTANIQTKIFTVTSSATVALKASVNWPARGTCYINSNGGSFIACLRIG